MKKLYFLFLLFLFVVFTSADISAQINITNGSTTSCTDTLFDSGGTTGSYTDDENFEYTISPTNATTVDISVDSINIASGDTLRIYDGTDTLAPLLYIFTDTSVYIPTGFISSTGGDITVHFKSDNSNVDFGFKLNWIGNITASVSLTATDTTVCSDDIITFTASPTNGGAPPVYSWTVNGSPVGTNSATYISTTSDLDSVDVQMASTVPGCAITDSISSAWLTMDVTTSVVASVSLTATDTAICSGTSVTFTAAPTNGGPAPNYAWTVNGIGVGSNSATYITTSLNDADSVDVELESSVTGGCLIDSISSDWLTIDVTSFVTASVSISVDDPSVCSGSPQLFTATPVNGGSSPTYSWRINGTPIANTAETYIDSTLSNNSYVAVTMASDNNSGCLTDSITADSTQLNINPNPSASISGSTNITCNGFTDGSATASGSGGTEAGAYDFLWNDGATQITATATALGSGTYIVTVTDDSSCTDTVSVFISQPNSLSLGFVVTNVSAFGQSDGSIVATGSGGTFIDNSGTANDGYDHRWSNGSNTTSPKFIHTNSSIASGWYTDTIIDDNNCVFFDSAFVDQPSILTGGEIRITGTVAKPICDQDTVGLINETAAISGGVGSPTYTWQKSTNLLTWQDIPSTNNINYTLNDSIATNTYIRRKVEDQATPSVNQAFSNIVVLNYIADATVTINGLNATYCENDPDNAIFGSPSGGKFAYDAWVDTTLNQFIPSSALASNIGLINEVTYNFTDINGCFTSNTTSTTVFSVDTGSVKCVNPLDTNELPQNVFDLGDTVVYLLKSTYTVSGGTFTGTGVYPISGVWYFDPSISGISYTQFIQYEYTNANGCTSYDSIEISVIETDIVLSSSVSDETEFSSCYTNGFDSIYALVPATDTVTSYRWIAQNPLTGKLILEDSNIQFTIGSFTDMAIPFPFDPKQFLPISSGVSPIVYDSTGVTPTGVTKLRIYFQHYTKANPFFTNLIRNNFELVNLDVVKIIPDQLNSDGTAGIPLQYCLDLKNVGFSSTVFPLPTRVTNQTYSVLPSTSGEIADAGSGNATFFPPISGYGSKNLQLTYTDSVTGCKVDTVYPLNIDSVPTVTLTGLMDSLCANNGVVSFVGDPYALGQSFFTSPTAIALSLTNVPGDSSASITTSPKNTGNHYVKYTYTETTGCGSNDSMLFVINPIPSLAIQKIADTLISDSLVHCFQDTATYEKLINSIRDLSASSTLTGKGFTASSDLFTADSVGIRTVSYSATDNNGCSNSIDTLIQVRALPNSNFIMATDTTCDYLSEAIKLSASFTGGIIQKWEFYGDTAFGDTANFLVASASGSGSYDVEFLTDDGSIWGCQDSSTQSIFINPLPNVSFNPTNKTFCILQGEGRLIVNQPSLGSSYFRSFTNVLGNRVYNNLLDSGILALNVDSIRFNLTDQDTSNMIDTVYVEYIHTDANGCINSTLDSIYIHDLPILSISTTNTGTICPQSDIISDLQGFANGFPSIPGLFSGSVFGINDSLVTTTDPSTSQGSYGPVPDTALIDTIYYSHTDANGCSNTTYYIAEIRKLPPASFTVDNTGNPNQKHICPDGVADFTSFYDNCPACQIYWNNVTVEWYVDTDSAKKTSNSVLLLNGPSFQPTIDTHNLVADQNYIIKRMIDNNGGCTSDYVDSVFIDSFPRPSASVNLSFLTTTGVACSNEGNLIIDVSPPSPGASNPSKLSSIKIFGGFTFVMNTTGDSTYTVDRNQLVVNTSGTFEETYDFKYTYTEPLTGCTADTISSFTLKTAPIMTYIPPAKTWFCPTDAEDSLSLFVFNSNTFFSGGNSAVVTGKGINPSNVVNSNGVQKYTPSIFFGDTLATIDTLEWIQVDVDGCTDTLNIYGFEVRNQPILRILIPEDSVCFDDLAITLDPQYMDVTNFNNWISYTSLSGPLAPKNKSFFSYGADSLGKYPQPWSGNQSFLFLPSVDSKDDLDAVVTNIVFEATYAGTNECSNTTDTFNYEIVTRPKPVADFTLNGFCTKYEPIMNGSNSTFNPSAMWSADGISSYLWEVDIDSAFVLNPADTLVTYTYPYTLTIGKHDFYLTVKTKKGCFSKRKNKQETFKESPDADFTWNMSDECAGETVLFTSTTVIPDGAKITYNWLFGDGNSSTDSLFTTHSYADTIKYSVTLEVSDGTDCIDTAIKDIYIRPIISHANNLFPYLDDFESLYSGWTVWEEQYDKDLDIPNLNPEGYLPTWFERGIRDTGNIQTKVGDTAWYLGYNKDSSSVFYENKMQTSVISPCFDLSGFSRPMLTIESIYQMESNDGAVVQYTTDIDKPLNQVIWNNVGDFFQIGSTHYPTGLEWYNKRDIFGNPGNQTDAQRKLGWTESRNTWTESRNDIDELIDEKYIRFRVAFGSSADSKGEGFIFDNFGIRERTKYVVFEGFVNGSQNSAFADMKDYDDNVVALSKDIMDIQYHTSFPASDPMNDDNTSDPSARSAFYGLSEVPFLHGDGNKFANFFNSESFGFFTLKPRALMDPKFRVNMVFDISTNMLETEIVPLSEDFLSSPVDVTLQIALVEKTINGSEFAASELGSSFSNYDFRNVLKRLYPTAAGTSFIGLIKGDVNTTTTEILYENFYGSTNEFKIIAFVQDKNTKEIYQGNWVDISRLNTTVGEPEYNNIVADGISYTLFPNPTIGLTYMKFDEILENDYQLNIYNQVGVLVSSETVPAGTQQYSFDINGLSAGMYFIMLNDGSHEVAIKKLMLSQ